LAVKLPDLHHQVVERRAVLLAHGAGALDHLAVGLAVLELR